MRKYIAAAAAFGFALPLFMSFAAPASAQTSAATAAQLTSQIQTLLQQVSALQAQVGSAPAGAGAASGGSCPSFARALGPGSTGADVSALQQFLARDSSVYPEAQVTGYYGALTQTAVQRFQVKYGITSSGSPSTTGYGQVGPRTAATIAGRCTGGGAPAASPGASDAPVGGFIQVTPVSGNAPLTVKVTATVNTTNSCAGATYTLDWGDGTVPQQIVVPPSNCTQLVQTLQHVYAYGGNFRLTLSAGTHQTYATVTVYGGTAPGTVTGNPGGFRDPGLQNESFNPSTLQGDAPLTVTFTGVVTSNDAGFGVGDNTAALDFGDGTMSKVQLPASRGGWLNYSVAHTYTTPGGYRAILHQGALSSPSVVGNATITVTRPASSSSSANYDYGIVSVSPGVGGNPLAVNLLITLPSCVAYQINWGDGTPISTVTAPCQSGGSSATIKHTYSASGSYTVSLNDGSGNSKASTGVSISS